MVKEPTKTIDCFSDDKNRWDVEKLKRDLPDEWDRLVLQQAANMRRYSPTGEDQHRWLKDSLTHREAIESLSLEFGDDGWEINRRGTIFGAMMRSTYIEASENFPE